MNKSKLILASLFLVFASVLLINSCGGLDAESGSESVGPAGPTTPNNYFFKLYESPSTTKIDQSITFSTYVYTSAGDATSDVTVSYSGSIASATTVTTGTDGWARQAHTPDCCANSTQTMTATVEDKSLTIQYGITD